MSASKKGALHAADAASDAPTMSAEVMDLRVSDLTGKRRWVRVLPGSTVGDLRKALTEKFPGSLMICVRGQMARSDEQHLVDLGLRSGSLLHAFESAPSPTRGADAKLADAYSRVEGYPPQWSECGEPISLSRRVEKLEVKLELMLRERSSVDPPGEEVWDGRTIKLSPPGWDGPARFWEGSSAWHDSCSGCSSCHSTGF
jgi:hypothetical protein